MGDGAPGRRLGVSGADEKGARRRPPSLRRTFRHRVAASFSDLPTQRTLPMRLPLIAPAELTPEKRRLYDDMRKAIASNFTASKVEREDGALMGPWNPWLHEPAIGKAIWDLTLAMTANASLADNVRQIAILVVGARFDAAYEIYAHLAVAEQEGT